MVVIRNKAAEAGLAFRAGELAADVLQVVQFNGQEEISRLFHFTLELASKDSEIDFAKVLGQPATLTIEGEPEQRFINGIVCRFEQAGRSVEFTRYRAELVPTVWLLTQRQDCQIFQEKSVPDIVKQVLEDAGVPSDAFRLSLQTTYKPRTYCVQYRESGWDFISRLLEEEGIFYFFEHTETAHVLVLGDNPNAHKEIAAPAKVLFNPGGTGVSTEEAFTALRVTQEIRPGSVVLCDFDFTHPSLDLTVEKDGGAKELQIYDYPGGYQDTDRGTALATARLQEEQAGVKQVSGRSDCRRLTSGFTFTLDGHERAYATDSGKILWDVDTRRRAMHQRLG